MAAERWLRRAWRGDIGPVSAAGLVALAGLYGCGVAVRAALYAVGVLRTRRLACPVISIGNITLGGSGKTPLTELVARAIVGLGSKPAVLSRGYGRRSRGVQIVADAQGVRLGARDGGDEPVLLAERLPGIPVVVGESRYEAGRVALERCGADTLVLDDGFQHRTLAKDLEIVAVAGRAPWGNGRMFPRGALREPVSALRRAHVIVVTNAPAPTAVEEIREALGRHADAAAVVAATTVPETAREVETGRVAPPGALRGRRLLAFAGLAAPEGFAATLRTLGADVAEVVEFRDHHPYTRDEIEALMVRARAAGAEALVTTEKDWVRVREIGAPGIPLWVLAVRMCLDRPEILGQALARALLARGVERSNQ